MRAGGTRHPAGRAGGCQACGDQTRPVSSQPAPRSQPLERGSVQEAGLTLVLAQRAVGTSLAALLELALRAPDAAGGAGHKGGGSPAGQSISRPHACPAVCVLVKPRVRSSCTQAQQRWRAGAVHGQAHSRAGKVHGDGFPHLGLTAGGGQAQHLGPVRRLLRGAAPRRPGRIMSLGKSGARRRRLQLTMRAAPSCSQAHAVHRPRTVPRRRSSSTSHSVHTLRSWRREWCEAPAAASRARQGGAGGSQEVCPRTSARGCTPARMAGAPGHWQAESPHGSNKLRRRPRRPSHRSVAARCRRPGWRHPRAAPAANTCGGWRLSCVAGRRWGRSATRVGGWGAARVPACRAGRQAGMLPPSPPPLPRSRRPASVTRQALPAPTPSTTHTHPPAHGPHAPAPGEPRLQAAPVQARAAQQAAAGGGVRHQRHQVLAGRAGRQARKKGNSIERWPVRTAGRDPCRASEANAAADAPVPAPSWLCRSARPCHAPSPPHLLLLWLPCRLGQPASSGGGGGGKRRGRPARPAGHRSRSSPACRLAGRQQAGWPGGTTVQHR